ncbi:hypothetical protein IPL85_00885 [Candidatus Saccharibacteria bacterium]|nr:MAG: hypothetical protein IPL85_00885 [Candidatus Saccharibacteria bacterium]
MSKVQKEETVSPKVQTPETETGRGIVEPGRQFVADFYNQLAEATSPYVEGAS